MIAGGASIILSSAVAYLLTKPKKEPVKTVAHFDNLLIGDIGGTNIRLQIVQLYHNRDHNRRKVIKELTIFKPQDYDSFSACLKEYLKDVAPENRPRIGVVGMAGPVNDNVVSVTVNIRHWGPSDGNKIAQEFGLDSFTFINDFTAAGYGISVLNESDYQVLGESKNAPLIEGGKSTKLVVGPGTGLGMCFLAKDPDAENYEVFPSEGGHTEYPVDTEEDWELIKFAREYIENSNNVENLRAKGKVGRVSIERLCAGPAVPLIYQFMKTRFPDLESTLEKES